jgi:hypothetical protein
VNVEWFNVISAPKKGEGMGILATPVTINGTTYTTLDNTKTLWEVPVGSANNALVAGESLATGPEYPFGSELIFTLTGQEAAWNGHTMPVDGYADDVGRVIHNGHVDWYQGIMSHTAYVPAWWSNVPILFLD